MKLRLQAGPLRYSCSSSCPGQVYCKCRSTSNIKGAQLKRDSRLIFLFVFGYRLEAISIIGKEVMLPRGLVRLGLDTLDQSKVEIRESLSLYTNPAAFPSIVHCTQGKDRTGKDGHFIQLRNLIADDHMIGLITALVLMILGVPIPAIEYDYSLTDDALILEREVRLKEIHEIGLTDEWANTAKDMIVQIKWHLDEEYGGLDNYLDQIGFGDDDRDKVREALLY